MAQVHIGSKEVKSRYQKMILRVPLPPDTKLPDKIAKDCLLTLVKNRLALGSPSWLVGCLVVRHHAEK